MTTADGLHHPACPKHRGETYCMCHPLRDRDNRAHRDGGPDPAPFIHLVKEQPPMTTRYRKKPVVIEAEQWLGQITQFIGAIEASVRLADGVLLINTLEGTMAAAPGDWIIKGVQGEYYPCKPDVFDATYEAVDA